MKDNFLNHWKTTVTGVVMILIYYLVSKEYIKPPFDSLLKENLEMILVSIGAIIFGFYAKDKTQ